MNDPINFDIESLVARYELHPDRYDLFVEGERDQALLRVFLERQQRSNVSVFPISVVNVPKEQVTANSLPYPSNRSAVITLALELEKRGVATRQVACIADADFDRLLSKLSSSPLLLFTDYASMELYAFCAESVHAVLLMVSSKTRKTGQVLLADFSGPLQFLFLVRATNYDLKLGLVWIEAIEKFFSTQNGKTKFDESEFLRRYLLIRLPSSKVNLFKARLGEISKQVSEDVRSQIRGHDFVKLLTWYLRKCEKCAHLNEEAVRQMLYLSLVTEALAKEPLFHSLLTRFPR